MYNWRAGASQPSLTTGTIFLYIYIYIYLKAGIIRATLIIIIIIIIIILLTMEARKPICHTIQNKVRNAWLYT